MQEENLFVKNVSVIIPTYNRAAILPQILAPLLDDREHVLEVIIADDGSTDDTVAIAREMGARVIELNRRQNANLCRNQGARVAGGEILLFLDSDVVLDAGSFAYLQDYFADPEIDGVVGVYSVKHRHENITSQYKNLWIRFSFLQSRQRTDWIFGAVSAIRREAFLRVNGFNEAYQPHNADDLDLGKRMLEYSFHIVLDPRLSVEHLKRHTLSSLLRNDFIRSRWFVYLADFFNELGSSWRKGVFNVYPRFILATPLAPLIPMLAVPAMKWPRMGWAVFFTSFLYLFLNHPFLSYLKKERGWIATLQSLPVLYLDHCACAAGVAAGLFDWARSRMSRKQPGK